ncbi:hypothetical protein KSP40_PGU010896 [Platanthera guangdongensis]|uniref:Uncharacterized protein n=1 Tax=Platanthera guangdongensis TaxID=2320717 RepID=A0ABR2MF63_9ASPA
MKSECCGLREDCTQQYISQVKSNFARKWLCGLCSETVRDDEKKAHMAFCSQVMKLNPSG